MIKDILSPHRALLSDHTELRAQKNTSRGVSMLGGNLVGNARTEKSGINARVYKNGVYGFASSAEYSEESIKSVLKAASDNAAFLSSRVSHEAKIIRPIPAGIKTMNGDINDCEQKVYIEFAKEDEDVFNLTWDEKEERTKTSTTRKMYERSEDKISESKIDKTTDKEKEFFGKRIVNFLKKCYNRCKNFITKIRKITNKMEMIGDLLEDEDIIDAVKRIKRYGVNGVKLLLPQKLNAKIIFGFEDPYYTGKVLGWTAALIPIYGDHINITPDFEKRILKGELKIKGRIRRYKILYLLWKVYKDKDELIKQKDRAIRMIGGS